MTPAPFKKFSASLRAFFGTSAAGGAMLVVSTLLAMIIANSDAASFYADLLHANIRLGFGDYALSKSVHHWINDGLMAIFFFMVGMEIKYEILKGHLSTRDQALLPALAAIGGMVVPALVFHLIAGSRYPELAAGWAIPSATDIAFALGILALLGDRIPASLKVLLLAIAVFDDLGAVVIIAVFYTSTLSLPALTCAVAVIAVMLTMNRLRVLHPAPYIISGICLWLAVLESGVHATLAGVVAALFIPLQETARDGESLLETMVHKLHPWIAFLIMPVFALANAGVNLTGLSLTNLIDPLSLAIACGLFIGKQIGIFGTIWGAVRLGCTSLPRLVNWQHVYGVAVLCGIGFTMSLFIGSLAYTDPELGTGVRLGVLAGSTVSAVFGYAILRLSSGPTPYIDEDN